jgi:hypothetical protein
MKLLALVIISVIHTDVKYFETFLITLFALILLSIINQVGILPFSGLILKIGAVLSIMSAIAFILVPMGILPVFSSFPNPDTRISNNYLLSFSNVNFPVGHGYFIRPSSIFDEPGQFALFLTCLLILNLLTIKNKKYEMIFIIGGLCTTSLAFMISLVLYLFFNKKKIKTVFFSVFFITIVLLILSNYKDIPMVRRLFQVTVDRVTDQILEGNIVDNSNRSQTMQNALEIVKDYPLFGIGFSQSREMKLKIGYNFFYEYAINGIPLGILDTLPEWYLIIITFLSFRKKGGIGLLILVNMVQRDFCAHIIYLILISLIIILTENRHEKTFNSNSNLQ